MDIRKLSVRLMVALAATVCLGTTAAAESTPGLDLTQFEGKVVVVDFWASWCVPCRRSFPWLNNMHAAYEDDGLVIIGVNLDEDRSEAEAFLEEFPAKFRIHYDDTRELAHRFDVIGMPSSYLLGRNGEVISQHIGFKVKKQDEYEGAIVEALGISE